MIDRRAIYYERKQREEERRAKLRTSVCAQCGSQLVLCYRPHDTPAILSPDELHLRCGKDKSHEGIVEQKSLRQLWKEKKVPIPLIVAQRFQDQEERRRKHV